MRHDKMYYIETILNETEKILKVVKELKQLSIETEFIKGEVIDMKQYKAYDHCLVIDLTGDRYAIIYDEYIEVWVNKAMNNDRSKLLTIINGKMLSQIISDFQKYRYELKEIRKNLDNNIVVSNYIDHQPHQLKHMWKRVFIIKDINC